MFVRPKSGLKVRHPKTKMYIPATGQEVSETDTYWAKRLRDGDVEIVKELPGEHSELSAEHLPAGNFDAKH